MSRGGRDNGAYPPCWLYCPQIGNTIGRFVPFKTPYVDTRNEVEHACVFEPADVMEWCKQEGIKLGLVIDLTKTSRYYSPTDFTRLGVKHVKLPCEGHKVTPKEQAGEFRRICSEFFRTNSEDYIGVHCTHGYNRTGYLISTYLVEEEDMDIDDALTSFKHKRPPGIYKEDYLRELVEKYDGDSEVEGQPRPEWDVEVEDLDEGFVDNTAPVNNMKRSIGEMDEPAQQPGRQRPVYGNSSTAEPSPHMIGIDGQVGELITGQQEWDLRSIVARQLHYRDPSRFPGSQPVSLDDTNIDLITHRHYQVSWKADGTRYMMMINGKNVFMIDRHNHYYRVPIRFPSRKRAGQLVEGTIVDGELVIDNVEGRKQPRFLIYDIIMFEKESVAQESFTRRSEIIKVDLIKPRQKEVRSDAQMVRLYETEPFKIRRKDFFPLSMAGKLLGKKFLSSLGHEADGLILMPVDLPYVPGRCMELLKWKPPHLNSIDFQVKKIGFQECNLMLIDRDALYKHDSWDAQDATEEQMKDLDGQIVECSLENGRWKFLRIRDDKSFPNSVMTGRGVMQSINSGITEEYLVELIAGLISEG